MIFRPKARTIAAREMPFLALLMGLVALFYWLGEPRWIGFAIVSAAIAFFILWRSILPAWRSWIRVDEDHLAGRIGSSEFSLRWSDMMAAKLETGDDGAFLHLATVDDSLSLPLADFEVSSLWREVQSRVPARALHPEAYKRLPAFADWELRKERLLTAVLEVRDARWVRTVCWAGLVFFVVCGALSFLADEPLALMAFGPLTLLSLVGIVQTGNTTVGPGTVTRANLLGLYELPWDAVRYIEISPYGDGLVLHAGERRLALPGPIYWSADEREILMECLLAHWELREIPVKESRTAAFRWSRGTKVNRRPTPTESGRG